MGTIDRRSPHSSAPGKEGGKNNCGRCDSLSDAATCKTNRRRSCILRSLDHVENDSRLLFEQIVKMDLEGMVCKSKSSPYRATEKPSPYWMKIKNRQYSQPE